MEKIKKYIYLINNFSHDFFTGLWLCSLLVLYIINREATVWEQTTAQNTIITFTEKLAELFFTIQIASLLLILVTGTVRYLDMKNVSTHHDKQRTILLIIKHILATLLFGWGMYLGYLWS